MVVFDVSQPLGEIQAPAEAVKSTAIALVKVDSTFLPGTTIGATHWVAYAMTKGRSYVLPLRFVLTFIRSCPCDLAIKR